VLNSVDKSNQTKQTLVPFILFIYQFHTSEQIFAHTIPTYPHMLKYEDSHKYCIIWRLLKKFTNYFILPHIYVWYN
jgi:hypothetical protein